MINVYVEIILSISFVVSGIFFIFNKQNKHIKLVFTSIISGSISYLVIKEVLKNIGEDKIEIVFIVTILLFIVVCSVGIILFVEYIWNRYKKNKYDKLLVEYKELDSRLKDEEKKALSEIDYLLNVLDRVEDEKKYVKKKTYVHKLSHMKDKLREIVGKEYLNSYKSGEAYIGLEIIKKKYNELKVYDKLIAEVEDIFELKYKEG